MVAIMPVTGHGQRAQDVGESSEETSTKEMKENKQPRSDRVYFLEYP